MKITKQKLALISVGVLLVVSIVAGLINPYLASKKQDSNSAIKPVPPSSSSSDSQSSAFEPQRVPVPSFTFYDMEGNEVAFEDFKGKPTVINFWATWCGYCKEEMSDFDKLIGEYQDKVNFVMLNATDGKQETPAQVKKYLEEEKFKNLVPYLDSDLAGINVFGVTSFPTTAFIDSEGNMFDAVIGLTNYDKVKAILDKELSR